jgi:hypothetical protein
MRPEESTTAPAAPWVQIAAEARWLVLHHLQHERREPVRRFLEEHVRRLEKAIRQARAA